MKHKQKYWHVWGKPSRDNSKTHEQRITHKKMKKLWTIKGKTKQNPET